MKKTQTKKKSGTAKTIAVLALSAIMLIGGGAVGYGAGTDWTYKRGTVDGNTNVEIDNGQFSTVLSEGENNGANFNVRALKSEEYDSYEIDAKSVESAYVAVVTLANHSEATDKSISLTAEFADGQSAAEYISFSSATVQSGEQFTITCKNAFGQPITIKATANGVLSGTKPSCSIKADYIRRFKAIYLSFGEDSEFVFDNRPYFADLRLSTDGGSGEVKVAVNNGDAPAVLFIKTDLNSTTDMSIGTITEGVKDVKIAYTLADHSVDTIQWDLEEVHPNDISGMSTNPAHLYYHWDDDDHFKSVVSFLEFAKAQAGGDYNSILSKYNSRTSSAVLAVHFTGQQSGINYTFESDIIVNPEGTYTAAQNPSFDDDSNGGIIF